MFADSSDSFRIRSYQIDLFLSVKIFLLQKQLSPAKEDLISFKSSVRKLKVKNFEFILIMTATMGLARYLFIPSYSISNKSLV